MNAYRIGHGHGVMNEIVWAQDETGRWWERRRAMKRRASRWTRWFPVGEPGPGFDVPREQWPAVRLPRR
jgi:hypothetical protein